MGTTESLTATRTAILGKLARGLPKGPPDFRDPATLATARRLADQILGQTTDTNELWALEQASTVAGGDTPRVVQLAVKLARSRRFLLSSSAPLTVSLVVPAYGETIRILPRGSGPGQHPDGEDFVVEKSRQLTWLFAGTPHAYNAVFVDDMSKAEPLCSGEAISTVIERDQIPDFRVLYLADGVREEKGGDGLVAAALQGVDEPKNTRKAGAVYYGFAKAIEAHGSGSDHVVVLTDCDLSVDVAQIGNLARPVADGAAAAAGSRRLPESVLEIEPGRNTRANAARYFREILLSGLLPRDTQCGAKAFSAAALADVLPGGMDVLDFSFDIELLTKLALRFGPARLVPVPVAWFDSSELTTTDSSVHLKIMQAQRQIALANATGSGPVFDEAARLAGRLIADEAVWLGFLDRLAANPELLREVEQFDTSALPRLEALISV